jgi:hypothetical protein
MPITDGRVLQVEFPVDGGAVERAEGGLDAGLRDVAVQPASPEAPTVFPFHLDVGDRLGFSALSHGVLVEIGEAHGGQAQALHGIHEGVDGAGARSVEFLFVAAIDHPGRPGRTDTVRGDAGLDDGLEGQGRDRLQILGLENGVDLFGWQLLAFLVGALVDDPAEFGLHGLGKLIAVALLPRSLGSMGR